MNVLAICHDISPLESPQAIQIGRQLANLEQYSILLVSGHATGGVQADIGIPQLKAHLGIPNRAASHALCRKIARLSLPLFSKTPDDLGSWRATVLEQLPDWAASLQDKIDVIASFGEPMSDHLIALELKRKTGLPWLAHFSDPWSDNPFRRGGWLTRQANRRLEQSVVESADIVVFTSVETAALVGQKYPAAMREKFRVLGHAFDQALFPAPEGKSGKLRISHIGSLYGARTPFPLLAGISRLGESAPDMLDHLSIELIGAMPGRIARRVAGWHLPKSLVRVLPPVSYRQSLKCMVESDLLVLIDAPAFESVFLASKLIEYIGAGVPVMAITPPGAAARVVGELGGKVVHPDDSEGIARTLKQLIPELYARRTEFHAEPWGNAEIRRRFEAGTVGDELRSLLDETRRSK